MSLKDFFKAVQWGTIFNLFSQIAEYYDNALSMISILRYYGLDYVGEGEDHIQVNCLLVEHGSRDVNKSARYYSYDRNTGEPKEGVYCFKCQKYLTPFWYIHKLEKEYREISIIDFFLWIKVVFRVDFPRDLVLDFDPNTFYTFGDTESAQNRMAKFSYAKSLRSLKKNNPILYLENIVQLYQTMKVGGQ